MLKNVFTRLWCSFSYDKNVIDLACLEFLSFLPPECIVKNNSINYVHELAFLFYFEILIQ